MQKPTSSTNKTKNTLPQVIKLGIDVHASTYVVAMKAIQAPRRGAGQENESRKIPTLD